MKFLSFISNPVRKRRKRKTSSVTGAPVKSTRRKHRVKAHNRNPMKKRTKSTRRRRSRKSYRKNPFAAVAANPRRRRRRSRKSYRRNPVRALSRRSGGESLSKIPWKRLALTGAAAGGSTLGSALLMEKIADKLPGITAHALVPTAYRVGAHIGAGFLIRKHASREIGEGVMLGGVIVGLMDIIGYVRSQRAGAGTTTDTTQTGNSSQSMRGLAAPQIRNVSSFAAGQVRGVSRVNAMSAFN